jgi:hypothetical protein
METAGSDVGGRATAVVQVRYEVFRGRLATWDDLSSKAAAFATQIGPENVI